MSVTLMTHARTRSVRPRNRIADAFGVTHYIRGLLQPLKHCIYSHYQVKKRQKGWYRKRSGSSKRLGTMVHRQMEHKVKGLPPKGRVHRYTKQLMAALEERKLRPLVSEVPLLSFEGAYLTHSDMLCRATRVDGRPELVVVSLKTGYSKASYAPQGACKAPCNRLKNTQVVHHLLQLACEVYVLQHEYGIPVGRGLILYAGYGQGRKLHAVDLPAWARDANLMRRLHDTLNRHAIIHSGLLPDTLQLRP